MKKSGLRYLLLWWGFLALTGGMVVTFDHWYWSMIAWSKREAYFRGMPTSRWGHRLHEYTPAGDAFRELEDGWPESSPVVLELFERKHGSAFTLLDKLGPKAELALPAIRKLKRDNPYHDPTGILCDRLIRKIEAKDQPQAPPKPSLELVW